MTDFNNYTNMTFATLPERVIGCNIDNCVINAATTFERCNLKNCTFNESCTFYLSNVIDGTFAKECVFDKSNNIDSKEEEERLHLLEK